jgi:hypothetical protein
MVSYGSARIPSNRPLLHVPRGATAAISNSTCSAAAFVEQPTQYQAATPPVCVASATTMTSSSSSSTEPTLQQLANDMAANIASNGQEEWFGHWDEYVMASVDECDAAAYEGMSVEDILTGMNLE